LGSSPVVSKRRLRSKSIKETKSRNDRTIRHLRTKTSYSDN
jgi:hypothetical protein